MNCNILNVRIYKLLYRVGVANKKTKTPKSAPKKVVKKVSKKTESMVAKVEVKHPRDAERVSRIVGTIFIVLGVLLVAFGVYSFVKYNSNPTLDDTLVPPSMADVSSVTKDEIVSVSGNASGYDTVFVYVNGEKVQTAKVDKDGNFLVAVNMDNEGNYDVTAAGVKGFPKRYISSPSLGESITIDRTAPELKDIKYATEVGTETFTVTGNVEPDAQVIVKRGTDYYSATCDAQGDFKIVSIVLTDEGINVYNVLVKDVAGNETFLEGKIKVTYSPDSDVDGDAVMDDSLPVAAGEGSIMKDFFLGNTLVVIFGILAFIGAATSTTVLYNRNKRG